MPIGRIVLWVLVLIAAVAIGAIALAALRRRIFHSGGDGGDEGFIPLHELRSMRSRGEISDEEYERLRAVMLGQFGVSATAAAPGSSASSAEHDPSERRAPPGYDLTGAPLPDPDEPEA